MLENLTVADGKGGMVVNGYLLAVLGFQFGTALPWPPSSYYIDSAFVGGYIISHTAPCRPRCVTSGSRTCWRI